MNVANCMIYVNKAFLLPVLQTTLHRSYAKAAAPTVLGGALKKKLGKGGPMIEKKALPVETDPTRLANYCCGVNIYKTGEDVKLLPDSEYPEWLWNIRTGPPPLIEELDPNSKQYWRRIRKGQW